MSDITELLTKSEFDNVHDSCHAINDGIMYELDWLDARVGMWIRR